MKRIALLIALIIAVGTTASLSAKDKTIHRSLSSFTEIDMNTVMQLKVKHGSDFAITITGDKKVIDELKIRVKGQRLIIQGGESRTRRNIRLKAEVTLPIALNKIDISGIGQIEVESNVDPDKFSAHISGLGKLKLHQITTAHFETSIRGLGAIEATGEAKSVKIHNSGMGKINCKKLYAKQADCTNSGMGTISVYASENITAKNSGMGSIRYFGNPKSTSLNSSGMGSVKASE